jgi:hypothetical protein
VRQWLIAPTPAWLETGLWQAAAEAIHGLSRAEIIAFGRSVADVARELAAYAQGAQVLSDAPTFDGKWLRDLYTAAGTEPPFLCCSIFSNSSGARPRYAGDGQT